ncbi:MAG TPA: hypothetical protein VFT22_41155 [Kofleriaceae bacterium]|nr:hypothetical protein [Kofleriaceae bacterium]
MGGIRGKTPKDCFDQFAVHLNTLVQSTLSRKAHLRVEALDEKGTLGWSDGQFLPITTQFGKLYFWLAQSLECSHDPNEAANKRYRLSTREYWYRLQRTDALDGASLIRWEYMSPRHLKYKDKRWCWRHVQLDGSKDLPGGKMNFDRLHTPSGYVVIEDVIRFLIHDLKVPPQSKNWHDLLMESDRKFKEDFNRW